jgi:hypothetical protein
MPVLTWKIAFAFLRGISLDISTGVVWIALRRVVLSSNAFFASSLQADEWKLSGSTEFGWAWLTSYP